MCVASRYLDQIDAVTKSMKRDYKKLKIKLSQYDKDINRIYHEIETKNFNACEGYYMSKSLKDNLQKRRLIKVEIQRMERLDALLVDSMHKQLPKAKGVIGAANKRNENNPWYDNFLYTFSDIEKEALH